MKKTIVAVFLGSENDLPQCLPGLELLRQLVAEGKIILLMVYIRSAHRHITELMWLLKGFCQADPESGGRPDVIIAGAGWAAILPGFIEACLRYLYKNTSIKVIGTAIAGKGLLGIIHTIAAIMSIKYVPKTQIVYAGWGWRGFLNAVRLACDKTLPEIKLPKVPSPLDLNLTTAIIRAEDLKNQN